MLIGVPAETTAGETRVAVTPETAKKIIAQGHTVHVQSGAGVAASVTDDAYKAAGAHITDAAGAPVTVLEPFMNAFAHITAVDEAGETILQFHPAGVDVLNEQLVVVDMRQVPNKTVLSMVNVDRLVLGRQGGCCELMWKPHEPLDAGCLDCAG